MPQTVIAAASAAIHELKQVRPGLQGARLR